MFERKYTRIDTVRNVLDEIIKKITNEETKRNAFVHLYGTGQACALIAMHRGFDRETAELAEIAGFLHDYSKYVDKCEENHAENSAIESEKILKNMLKFTDEEIQLICHAIRVHSNKENIDSDFDEILKDADEMQHYLRNPNEDYYFAKDRVKRLIKEFNLTKGD